jgi:hypothetical protein
MLRKRNGILIGHAPITSQLDWCEKARAHRAIFTHCGSPIVRADPRQVEEIVRRLGRERGIDARIAYDGLTLRIGSRFTRRGHVLTMFQATPAEQSLATRGRSHSS